MKLSFFSSSFFPSFAFCFFPSFSLSSLFIYFSASFSLLQIFSSNFLFALQSSFPLPACLESSTARKATFLRDKYLIAGPRIFEPGTGQQTLFEEIGETHAAPRGTDRAIQRIQPCPLNTRTPEPVADGARSYVRIPITPASRRVAVPTMKMCVHSE